MGRPRLALVPSTDVFEDHFGRGLGLTRAQLGGKYRNDFLFLYSTMLSKRGWDIDLVLLSSAISEPERHSGSQAPDIVYVPVPRGARWLLRCRRGPLRYVVSLVLTWLSLRGHLDDYGSVYCQEFNTGRYLALTVLCRRRRLRLVGAHHGGSLLPWQARLLRLVGPWRDEVTVTALTEAEARHTRELLGSQAAVHHVPNPVEDSFLRVAQDHPRAGMVFLGRLFDDQKRLSDLLHAVAQLPPGLWAPLVVIGDGPDRASLEALSMELGLADNVVFRGFLYDRELLRQLLSRTCFHAMPSAYEGAPLAVLETQAAGVLPLVTDLPAFRECMPADTYRVPVGDRSALSAVIAAVHELTEAEVAARRHAHREFVRTHFSMDVAGATLAALLEPV